MRNNLSCVCLNNQETDTALSLNESDAKLLRAFVKKMGNDRIEIETENRGQVALFFSSKKKASSFYRHVLLNNPTVCVSAISVRKKSIEISFCCVNEAEAFINNLEVLVGVSGQVSSSPEGGFLPNWLLDKERPFGILRYESFDTSVKTFSAVKDAFEKHLAIERDDLKLMSLISGCRVSQWSKDMVALLEDNTNLNALEASCVVDAVVRAGYQLIFNSCSDALFINDKLCRRFNRGASEWLPADDDAQKYFNLARLNGGLIKADNQMVRGLTERSVFSGQKMNLWEKVVFIAGISSAAVKKIVPNGYSEAEAAWLKDEAIPGEVLFVDTMMRGELDCLYSPKAALSLSNLIYSEKSQGVSISHSFIGFIARDLMRCLGLLFCQKQREALLDLSKSQEALRKIDPSRFWQDLYKELVSDSRRQFFADYSAGRD